MGALSIRAAENTLASYSAWSIVYAREDSNGRRSYAAYAKEGSVRKHFGGRYSSGVPAMNALSCAPSLVFYVLSNHDESTKLPTEVPPNRVDSFCTGRGPVLVCGTDASTPPNTAEKQIYCNSETAPTVAQSTGAGSSKSPVKYLQKTLVPKRGGKREYWSEVSRLLSEPRASALSPVELYALSAGKMARACETAEAIAKSKRDAREKRLETYHQTRCARGYTPNVYTIGSAIASGNEDDSLDSSVERVRGLLGREVTGPELVIASVTFAISARCHFFNDAKHMVYCYRFQ